MSAWTKEFPTVPGWYFVREVGKSHTMECVEICRTMELDGRLVIYRAGVDSYCTFASYGNSHEWQPAIPKP